MITFRSLGSVELKGSDGNELQSILARPKLLGLLSYLVAASPPGFRRRDTLMNLFWAETEPSRARSALRQSLYYLRQSLGNSVLIGRGEDELSVDPEQLWCDVIDFETALADGNAEQALELYRGDLLAGFFISGAPEYERWLEQRRDELRRKACAAAWELADRAEADGNSSAGHWARRATELAPFDEKLAAQAIGLLDRTGDRAGAIRLYETFAQRLEDELDLQPSPETQALVDEIRSRREVLPARVASEALVAAVPDEVVPVERTDAADKAELQPEVAHLPARRMFSSSGFRLGLVAGIGAVVVLGLLWPSGPEPPVLDPQRVVVAVFDNETGEPELDPIGRMAADWITQGLDAAGVADVVPSTINLASRADFSDRESSGSGGAMSLAEATGAGVIVAGSYFRRGDSVEFQAQIINARDGSLLSSVAPIGGPLSDPGAAVDSLQRIVARTVAVALTPGLGTATDLSRPPSLESYREYLEGVRSFRSPQRQREALTYFYRALELDSSFVTPRMYIVFAHGNLGERAAADSNAQLLVARRPELTEYQRNTLDWQLAMMRGNQMAALEAARARGGLDVGVQALRVNRPREAVEALMVGEEIWQWYYHWLTLIEARHMLGDFEGELAEARTGRDRYPERMRMLGAELRALASLGRISDVERGIDASLLLPVEDGVASPQLMGETAAELRAHGFRQASLDMADRAVQWFLSRPAEEMTTWLHRYGLALAYYQQEAWPEARRLFEGLALETPDDVNVNGFLGVLAARRGERAAALRIGEVLEGMAAANDFGREAYWQACIAAQLGYTERAMVLLRQAYAEGRPFTILVHRDMDLEPLHGYPPFEDFLEPKG